MVGLFGQLDAGDGNVLQHVVEHAVGVDAGGERLVGEHDAVAQHVAREVAHVGREHVVAPAQQRERAARVHEVDRAARRGAELDPVLLAALARRRGQRDGVLHHAPVDVDRLRGGLVAGQRRGVEHLAGDSPVPSSERSTTATSSRAAG